jgi:hypothetical protein
LLEKGIAIVVHDSRGRRKSGLSAANGGRATYEDYVLDVGPIVDAVEKKMEERHKTSPKIFLSGHSQFAHVSLAWLSMNSVQSNRISGLILFGGNSWVRMTETSPLKWLLKLLMFAWVFLLTVPFGYIPGRKLKIGSQDESLLFWRSFFYFAWHNYWGTVSTYEGPVYEKGRTVARPRRSKEVNYWERLPLVQCPILTVVSEGDYLECKPEQGILFTERVPKRDICYIVGRTSKGIPAADQKLLEENKKRGNVSTLLRLDAPKAPDHMGMLTSVTSRPAWDVTVKWIQSKM